MIPRTAYFFWAGGAFSFLRFLSIVSFRKKHPGWKIELYLGKNIETDVKWKHEQQDFQHKQGKDYLSEVKRYCNFIGSYEAPIPCAPNFQSDFFRWETLKRGGWYLDNDQIILKPFDCFVEKSFVYAAYQTKKHGLYTPIGVIGAQEGSPIVKTISDTIKAKYDRKLYGSIGPGMFKQVYLKQSSLFSDAFNTGRAFYPANFDEVGLLYNGKFKIPESALAIHWFAGHSLSQKFNLQYTPKTLAAGTDTLSREARKILNG